MYVNKCIKCGSEFETKNPKRVICPNCLYPDKSMMPGNDSGNHDANDQQQRGAGEEQNQNYSSSYNSENSGYSQDGYSSGGYSTGGYSVGGYSAGGYSAGGYSAGGYDNRGQGGYQSRGGYDNRNQGGYQSRGGYNNRGQGGYQSRGGYDNRGQGGYQSRGGYDNRNQGGYQSRGGYSNRNQGPQRGGFNRGNSRPGGFQNRRPGGRPQRPQQQKQLLINKEQLEQIEALYKTMLPLPNPDAHEVIGEKIGLEPKKVFFGINLVRQKMMLPKLPFPKRKLAISPDQLMAIRSLYEPMLPLPPIGCHKIIALQLKMDEWRVHVGIGLIRGQMGLERWNSDRPDAPEEFKNSKPVEPVETEEKPKRTRKSKKAEAEEAPSEIVSEEKEVEQKPEKKTRGRKPKKTDEE
ncbi:MAG: hypothetical protein ACI37S_03835 [Candidatus Gastranaerophilaceae bacterium]